MFLHFLNYFRFTIELRFLHTCWRVKIFKILLSGFFLSQYFSSVNFLDFHKFVHLEWIKFSFYCLNLYWIRISTIIWFKVFRIKKHTTMQPEITSKINLIVGSFIFSESSNSSFYLKYGFFFDNINKEVSSVCLG